MHTDPQSTPQNHGDGATPAPAVAPDATPPADAPLTAQAPAPVERPDVNPPGMEPLPPELGPPSSIADYRFPSPEDTPEARAADVEARGWMLAAGLPGSIGTYIAQEIGRMPDPSGGDDATFELSRASLMAQLDRMYGPEATAAKLRDVQRLVEHVDRKSGGRLGDYLEANAGVLLSLQVFGQLAVHAERMRGRLR